MTGQTSTYQVANCSCYRMQHQSVRVSFLHHPFFLILCRTLFGIWRAKASRPSSPTLWQLYYFFWSPGPVVLVLYNAGPLDVSWAQNSNQVVAILESFFPAQSAGIALAYVLTGQYNPGGRLPNTWPASLDQVSSSLVT